MNRATLFCRLRITQFAQTALLAAAPPLALLLSAAVAFAQLPATQFTSIYPPGAKQGAKVDVTIAGADLDDADKLVFSHPGISAAIKMGEPSEFQKAPRPVANSFSVQVAGDVPVGTYEVRAVSRFGVSNPRSFVVSGADELVEASLVRRLK